MGGFAINQIGKLGRGDASIDLAYRYKVHYVKDSEKQILVDVVLFKVKVARIKMIFEDGHRMSDFLD